MNLKFSIVIPMYNTEKYIKQSIESVIDQNYENWEMLLVDDGSSDGSLDICKIYAMKDSRIKIFHLKRKGVSAARNLGIKHATGDYIMFLDSDDYYADGIFSFINDNSKTKKYDLYVTSFVTHKEDGKARDVIDKKYNCNRINDRKCSEILKYFYQKRMIYTVWRFAIKKEVITENKLFFIEGIIHEDEEWVPKLLCSCKTFYFVPFPFYNYRLRENSLTTSPTMYNYECYLKVAQLLCEYASKERVKYKKIFYQRCAYKNSFLAYLGIRKLSNPLKEM